MRRTFHQILILTFLWAPGCIGFCLQQLATSRTTVSRGRYATKAEADDGDVLEEVDVAIIGAGLGGKLVLPN